MTRRAAQVYRAGLALREWRVPADAEHTLLCATFHPGVAAAFRLVVGASVPFGLSRL